MLQKLRLHLHKQLTKNKHVEFIINDSLFRDTWFTVDLSFAPKGYDHAGFSFLGSIGKYSLELAIYDSRHWDDKKGDWEEHE